MDTQVLQLAASSTPSDTMTQLVQAQFESIQQRQQRLVEELTALQAKLRLASTLLSRATTDARQQQPQQILSGVSGNTGLLGQSAQVQLAQLLQMMTQGANTAGTAQAQALTNQRNLGLSISSLIEGQAPAPMHSSNLGRSGSLLQGAQLPAAPSDPLTLQTLQQLLSLSMNNQQTHPPA